MAAARFTDGQRYLICWAASSPTRGLYTGASVPTDAPNGVSMTGLRGLEKRGFFHERRQCFFDLTDAGLRLAASWADEVERLMLRRGGDNREIAAWRADAAGMQK